MTLKGKTFSFNEETLIYQVLSKLFGVAVSGTGGKVQDYSSERVSVLLTAAKAVQNSSKQFECKNKLRVSFFIVIFPFETVCIQKYGCNGCITCRLYFAL